ncbi:MAG: LPS export ABC transporter ATP-binding protein [Elusimicrobia bacterium RIFOXYA2_FULL_39_19]|nr:MAG: LPS export ABC transporter ATP-binding protein [Elusimicrobia bacterium RIFOXYA2_FULL_39_19]
MKLRSVSLVKSFKKGKKAVNDVSLEVNRGEIVGLLGPNGAGKTTIFKMIVGSLLMDSGSVYLGDKNVTGMPMFKRAQSGISYLPQEPSIFKKLTVEENLLAIAEYLKIPEKEKKEKIEHSIQEFGLDKLRNQKAYSLSGGEKRRTEIARALLINPVFLMLDEPFVGIDPITVNEIQHMIKILKAKNIGILITDHNVRETLEIIDRAYIIYDGKILLEGDAKSLLENAEARRVYLGEKFNTFRGNEIQ